MLNNDNVTLNTGDDSDSQHSQLKFDIIPKETGLTEHGDKCKESAATYTTVLRPEYMRLLVTFLSRLTLQ